MKYPITRYPGVGKRLVICDVCGSKMTLDQTVRITDKWNTLYGMVVCKQDADRTNPQAVPFKIKEKLVTRPLDIRPEPADVYVTNPNDNRAPSAPQNLIVTPSPLGSTIYLNWNGPSDNGSSAVIGYEIQIQRPQGTATEILVANTYSGIPFFEDTSNPITGDYTYAVAAINSFGTGPFSSSFDFPFTFPSVNYLCVSQDSSVLTASNGDYIIL